MHHVRPRLGSCYAIAGPIVVVCQHKVKAQHKVFGSPFPLFPVAPTERLANENESISHRSLHDPDNNAHYHLINQFDSATTCISSG